MSEKLATGTQRWDWASARTATVHCLTGCTIGEVSGLAIGQFLGLPAPATIALAIGLAFVFGFALAAARISRLGLPAAQALRIAVVAETISIAVMETVNNGVILAVPGALDAGLTSALFWGVLALSLAVAFLVTLPVNAWLIARGQGHARYPAH